MGPGASFIYLWVPMCLFKSILAEKVSEINWWPHLYSPSLNILGNIFKNHPVSLSCWEAPLKASFKKIVCYCPKANWERGSFKILPLDGTKTWRQKQPNPPPSSINMPHHPTCRQKLFLPPAQWVPWIPLNYSMFLSSLPPYLVAQMCWTCAFFLVPFS